MNYINYLHSFWNNDLYYSLILKIDYLRKNINNSYINKKITIFLIQKLFKKTIIGFISNRNRYQIVEMSDNVSNTHHLVFIDKRYIVASFSRDHILDDYSFNK